MDKPNTGNPEYIECANCGKKNLPHNTIYQEVVFQDRDHRGKRLVNSKVNPYCKDTDCARCHQLSLEG
jgi:hypothetical protein